jgi:hypothetical protein
MALTKMAKTPVPPEVEKKMKAWRRGFAGFPIEYIEFNEKLANDALAALKAEGFTVHKYWLATDGWFDGMKAVYAIVERSGNLYKLQWNDSNQEFFLCHPNHGGSSPFRLALDRKDKVP